MGKVKELLSYQDWLIDDIRSGSARRVLKKMFSVEWKPSISEDAIEARIHCDALRAQYGYSLGELTAPYNFLEFLMAQAKMTAGGYDYNKKNQPCIKPERLEGVVKILLNNMGLYLNERTGWTFAQVEAKCDFVMKRIFDDYGHGSMYTLRRRHPAYKGASYWTMRNNWYRENDALIKTLA